MEKLSLEQINKLNYNRLRNVMKGVRGIICFIERNAGPRCCEICHEYIGSNWKEYFEVLREASKKFPHMKNVQPKAKSKDRYINHVNRT